MTGTGVVIPTAVFSTLSSPSPLWGGPGWGSRWPLSLAKILFNNEGPSDPHPNPPHKGELQQNVDQE